VGSLSNPDPWDYTDPIGGAGLVRLLIGISDRVATPRHRGLARKKDLLDGGNSRW